MGPPSQRTLGYLSAQCFDATDVGSTKLTVADRTQRILGAGRYALTFIKSVPVLKLVAGTFGPIGGWISWPAKPGNARKLAQVSMLFPAKLTSAGPPMLATAIKTGDGTGWLLADDLDDIVVLSQDGKPIPVNTFGLVIQGADLTGQTPLFFPGSAGAGSTPYKVISSDGAGNYTLREYDHPDPGGTATAGAPDIPNARENNGSVNVPNNEFVEGTVRGDGLIYFNIPFGC